MSTTNPTNPGGQLPGGGVNWPADARHGSAADEHGGGGGVNPDSIKAGHEPDAFAVKPILSVPLAVVVTFVIAFAVAAGVFAFVMAPKPADPFAHKDAIKRGEEALNERLARTERQGLESNPRREVDQPRLEPLRRLESNGQFYLRTAMPTGNSPEIHPDEIRPDRVAALQQAAYVDKDKKYARIPIGDAMKLATENKELQKSLFPVQKAPSPVVRTTDRPTPASAGHGLLPPLPKEPEQKGPTNVAPQPKTGNPPEKKEPQPSGKKEPPKTETQPKNSNQPEKK